VCPPRALRTRAEYQNAKWLPSMTCSICYEPLTKGKTLKTTCKHVFHAKCIKGWYKTRHNSCPMCRAPPAPRSPDMCIEPTCTESPTDERAVWCSHHMEMRMLRMGIVAPLSVR